MFGILNFTRITNIFDGTSTSWRAPWREGVTVGTYLPTDANYYIEVGGAQKTREHVLHPGDFITVIELPGGATAILTFLLIAVSIGSFFIARNAVPKLPSGLGESDGPANSFGGIQTSSANGIPIPLIYGKVRVGGNIVDSFESEIIDAHLIDDIDPAKPFIPGGPGGLRVVFPKPNRITRAKSALNNRVALCMGPVESITDFEIDSRAAKEFPGLVVTTKHGTQHQTGHSGFDRIVTTRALASPLTGPASSVTTLTLTEVDAFEVLLRFPKGIYKIKKAGFRYFNDIDVKVEYQLENATAWTDAGTFVVQDMSLNPLEFRITVDDLERAKYNIRVTRITPDSGSTQVVDDLEWLTLTEIDYEDRNHPGIAFLSFIQIPGDHVSPINPTNFTAIVKGFNDIRQYTTETVFTTSWTDNPAWCCAHFLTSKLHGLGIYFDWSDIDIGSFMAWAAHNDAAVFTGRLGQQERQATFNHVFDSSTNALSVLQTFASGSGAMLIYKGAKWRAILDEPKPMLQVFNESNITEGSLGYAWFPKSELATQITAHFVNLENDYERDSIMQEDPDITAGKHHAKKSISLLHVTRPSQVARELTRMVNYNKFVTKGVEFKTGLQGVKLELGDVFGVATKTAGVGIGSGIITAFSVDSKTLHLDDDVKIESGKSYEITIQHKYDGVITKKSIATVGPVTTNIVEVVDAVWNRGLQSGDKYSIGEVDSSVEQFRVDDLKIGDLGPGFSVEVRGALYDTRVFDLSPVSNPPGNPPEVPNRDSVPGVVKNLSVSFTPAEPSSRVGRMSDKTIHVDWNPPASFSILHYEVFWRDTTTVSTPADQTWLFAGTTTSRRFEITRNVDVDIAYQIAVIALSPGGLRLTLEDAAKAKVTTY